jgi:hypothetical protein
MTNNKHTETGQPDGQHHNTHLVYHLQHLIHTTPLNTTRPEPYRTLQQLTCAELITPARKTIAQLARTQHPYPNHIPNRYYRHFQRYFDPDAAFQHLFRHTLHAVPTDHPYTIALDGTTVPRTGAYIPGAHWTPNPTNAPFARGLRKAQRFVMAGWLDDDPNARCVPIYWLPTFSHKARYANPTSRRSEIQGWIATLQQVRAWLDAAGRAEQRLLCVGDGRGDTQALGKLELPNTVCCVRTRKDSRWCDLPQGAPSGRGRRRVYSDPVWTPQDKWQQRTGWQRVPLVVRGRAVRLLVRAGSVSSGGVGRAGVFCDCCARTSQAHQAGQVARADGVLGSRGVGWRGRVAVACAVGGVVVEVVAALGGGGGVSLDEERFWVGGEAVLGF